MRTLLALLILNGLSMIAWGTTGLCRLADEQKHRPGRQVMSIIAAMLLACLLASVVLAVALDPLLQLLAVGTQALALERATAATLLEGVAFASIILVGGLASYLATRLFHLRAILRAHLVFAALFWLATLGLALDTSNVGPASAWQSAHPIGLLITALFASCLGMISSVRFRARSALSHPEGDDADGEVRRIDPSEVAVVICAYNEEDSIATCLDAVSKVVPISNIFVGSDGSSDETTTIARAYGVNVLEMNENGGKAKTLDTTIKHFGISDRFEAALVLDADAEIDEHYLENALPLFDDPGVVAVAGHAVPTWQRHWLPRWKMYFLAYRTRLYWITQAFLRYGQTWKHSNVSFIVPGFASLYRCSVLPSIDIAASNLSVEDFNMTFDIHHKGLGRIAYTPRARCVSQEAHRMTDYVKQVRRWYLGFWQTVRRHRIWSSFFWLSLGLFVLEMLLQSIAFLTVPVVLVWFLALSGDPIALWLPQLGTVDLALVDVVVGVLIADYVLTVIVAFAERKPMLFLYGIGFTVLRWVDAFLFLYTLPLAFVAKSDGRWVSPARIH